MPEQFTHGDALRFYLTGAASDGGAQADPNLSLGKFRSSTEELPLSWVITGGIAGITVEFVSGANGTGAGTLTATGSSEVKWTPPGGTQGAAVSIANGETKIIEAGASAFDKFVRVTRTSAGALSGTATLTLSVAMNNVVGFDDVSSAEQAAGDTEYRCIACRNVSGADIQSIKVKVKTLGTQRVSDSAQLGASGSGAIQTSSNFDDWPASGYALIKTNAPALREIVHYTSRTSTVLTVPAAGRALLGTSAAAGAATDTVDAIPGIAIGLDAPTSQPAGSFEDQTGAGEGVAPSGVTFSTPIKADFTDALNVGTLTNTQIYGVWIKRQLPAGAEPGPSFTNGLQWNFDSV